MPDLHVYAACEVRGPNLIFVRRCAVCGEMATTVEDRVMGRLPESCRTEHGNETVEVPAYVPMSRAASPRKLVSESADHSLTDKRKEQT